MQPITIQFAVRVGYVRTIRNSRENNIRTIDLPDGSTSTLPLYRVQCLDVYLGDVWGYSPSGQHRFAGLFLIKWTVKLDLK